MIILDFYFATVFGSLLSALLAAYVRPKTFMRPNGLPMKPGIVALTCFIPAVNLVVMLSCFLVSIKALRS